MQEIKREVLVQKASEMLASGTVDRVLGWKVGEFDYARYAGCVHIGG